MNLRLGSLASLLIVGAVLGQYPVPTGLPSSGPSPLTYVRFTGPQGMVTTFYQGRARPRAFTSPTVVGMRPGYIYRMQVSNFADRPGWSLYPTIEVRGSLKLQPRFGASQFPATIHLSQQDIDAAAAGTLITKVIYLEDPDRAEPTATKPGEILEYDMPRSRDIYKEARTRGRIMLVVHLGERKPTDEELIRSNIPGTILHPGEKVVSPAQAPPCMPMIAPGYYDPWYGPRPFDEECIRDGGDRLAPAGIDVLGQIGGIDPEDTIAEYRDSAGRRQLIRSNRVCLCVPRFAALRKVCPLAHQESVFGPLDRKLVKSNVTIADRTPSLTTTQAERLRGMQGRQRPSINLNVEGPGHFTVLKVLQAQQLNSGVVDLIGTKKISKLSDKQKAEAIKQLELVKEFSEVVTLSGYEQILHTSVIGRVENGPETITSTVAVRDLTVCCNEAPIPPDRPLVLFKCADRGSAKPGDIVTFTLRYSNVGGRPMTDVAVIDSLSARLEYVPGSAETDRDAVFTVQPNEAGSQLLRWEITGRLLPGQTGRIRFKAKVR